MWTQKYKYIGVKSGYRGGQNAEISRLRASFVHIDLKNEMAEATCPHMRLSMSLCGKRYLFRKHSPERFRCKTFLLKIIRIADSVWYNLVHCCLLKDHIL
jgi:hypothetical protein